MKHPLVELAHINEKTHFKYARVEFISEDGTHYVIELNVNELKVLASMGSYPKIVIEGMFIDDAHVAHYPYHTYSTAAAIDEDMEMKKPKTYDPTTHPHAYIPPKPIPRPAEEWKLVEDETLDFSHVGHTFEEAMRSLTFVDTHIDNDASVEDKLSIWGQPLVAEADRLLEGDAKELEEYRAKFIRGVFEEAAKKGFGGIFYAEGA